MGVWGRIKGAVSNFYGGNNNDDYYDDDENDYADDGDNDESEEDDNPSGYGDDSDNPSGYGEDEAPEGQDVEDDESGAPASEKPEVQMRGSSAGTQQKKASPFSKIGQALMKKEAIIHGCSPRVEMLPCPICHAKSIYMSLRPFDWFPLLVGARIIGVPLYRFYCFNKKCKRSWYTGYVFNCPTEKFQPASVPTKRQFNSM